MQDVYVEPVPKGRYGPIDGYKLEFHDGSRVSHETFLSEARAIREAKLRGYVPMLAKVRITDKRETAHWQSTEDRDL
ncbi:conserved hypothetical protein [Burkholderia sp. 8Y]|uniref:hypothetical protein n=1 Tax=Burkholderia sp. 8Y TaxID=2653133 RepID=UPI0012F4062E|nr:hypothetical protein [Burkholderia sp. 8Y]VXC96207.1 conserved hypothetical protein [Burkholderia sp. 8Y]